MDTASHAVERLIDAFCADSENTEQRRESFFRNILHAVDREITGRGGLLDKQQDLADRVLGLKHGRDQLDVPRIDDQSDISVTRNSDHERELEDINYQISVAEHVRARLAEDFQAGTGEHWLPRASYSPKKLTKPRQPQQPKPGRQSTHSSGTTTRPASPKVAQSPLPGSAKAPAAKPSSPPSTKKRPKRPTCT